MKKQVKEYKELTVNVRWYEERADYSECISVGDLHWQIELGLCMKLCWIAETLKLPQEDKDQIFIRMVFNYVAGISDDHNKNISFIMDKAGVWRLSPAYDVMFTANTWENSSAHIHSMGVMGKRSALTTSDFVNFAEDFVEEPEKKILQVFDAVSKFQSLCATYGIDKAIFDKIQHVLDGLVTDDLDLLQLT